MFNIKENIKSIPCDRIAFINNNSSYSYNDIHILALQNKTMIDKLRNKSLVIKGRERLEFALLLTLLDGIASKILFLPDDIDTSLYNQFYSDVNVEFEVYIENNVLKCIDIANEVNIKLTNLPHTEWIIPTSGTTNIPKLVSHSFKSLTKSTKLNVDVGEKYIWGLVFDIYRFSGIQVFLQSLLSGSSLIITNPHNSMVEILNLLSVNNCNALSATPSFWRKVLMTANADRLSLNRITLGGEIADNNILKALKEKFKKAKISHIYASTEVGVGFSVTDGKEGFPSSYLFGELDGIKMKIDEEGLLWISPVNHEQKYLSNEKMYDEYGYINTGDLVKEENSRIYFQGRNSGAINVGGNKVQPEEVEAALLSTNLISAAYVYPMKNAMMGALVCADLVPIEDNMDKKILKMEILKISREKLEGFKVPAIIKFVKELETTQSGKLKRKKL